MFIRASALVLAIAAGVIACSGGTTTTNQCNNGQLQCCNSIETPNQASKILSLDPTDLTGMIGINCNDLSVVGGGVSCSQQAACCSGIKQVGVQVVSVECSPINLGL